MTTEAVIEGTAEEIVDHKIERVLVPAPRQTFEVLKPLDVDEQAAAMALYQEGLKSILDESDWQSAGRDRFVKKSGWRKIAAWFSLSIELVADEVDRDDEGHILRAKVWARAHAPNGRFADGDGYCDVEEKRFKETKGRQKLENDLRGTAATRAVNRAISNLVGMGAVSAEEIDFDNTTTRPPSDKPFTRDQYEQIVALFAANGSDADLLGRLLDEVGAVAGEHVADRIKKLTKLQAFALITSLENAQEKAA